MSGDTTFEDPCHFIELGEEGNHQWHQWCPCGTISQFRNDYAGLWWGVRHRAGGAVYGVPMSALPPPPSIEITLYTGVVITLYGLSAERTDEMERKLTGDGRHFVEVICGQDRFQVAEPGVDEPITAYLNAGAYRRLRPIEVTALDVAREPAEEASVGR